MVSAFASIFMKIYPGFQPQYILPAFVIFNGLEFGQSEGSAWLQLEGTPISKDNFVKSADFPVIVANLYPVER